MRQATASFLTLCLFLWVLPLGNFIKPSQERTACGGGRAFHMCTMDTPKIHAESAGAPVKIAFTNTSGVEKTHKVSSGGAEDILLVDPTKNTFLFNVRYKFSHEILRYSDFISSIEPIPKA